MRAGEWKYKGQKKSYGCSLVAEGASPYPPSKIVKEYGAAATVCCGGVCLVLLVLCVRVGLALGVVVGVVVWYNSFLKKASRRVSLEPGGA